MKILIALAIVILAGCSTAATDYYQAVEKAAQANAIAAQAKFDALSKIAAAGDGQAASAAVMALALTQTPTVTPVPQQSAALQWASVLAAPVSNLGMMWMQTDSTKTMARYNAQVDLARISADAATQEALYGSFVAANATTGEVALGGYNALGNIDYTPFIDGMVDLGTTGMDNLLDLGTAGFDANTEIATVGITQVGLTAEDGLNVAANISNNAMTNLVTLGTNGLETAESLGIQGMTGIYTNTLNWLNYSNDKDNIIKDMLANEQSGCIVTTNESNQIVVTCN